MVGVAMGPRGCRVASRLCTPPISTTAGCTGWSAKKVMPLFSDDFEFGERAGHGCGGPLPVYRAPPENGGPIDRGLRDAALASGYPWCADVKAGRDRGYWPSSLRQVSTKICAPMT